MSLSLKRSNPSSSLFHTTNTSFCNQSTISFLIFINVVIFIIQSTHDLINYNYSSLPVFVQYNVMYRYCLLAYFFTFGKSYTSWFYCIGILGYTYDFCSTFGFMFIMS